MINDTVVTQVGEDALQMIKKHCVVLLYSSHGAKLRNTNFTVIHIRGEALGAKLP